MTRSGASVHKETVEGFGYEWSKFDQSEVDSAEADYLFDHYFALFPWDSLPANSRGFDLGCGSGRWARLAAEHAGTLICLDASSEALEVAKRNAPGCPAVVAAAGALPIQPGTMDFGYSLGVLHHIPDPLHGMTSAVEALKPGAPFLVYLYYAFDNRPAWFRSIWSASDVLRRSISRCPPRIRYGITGLLAGLVYLPCSTLARWLEMLGRDVSGLPLSSYRNRSFYAMRTDALDRFGTRLEKRFTKSEVADLMTNSGLDRVVVSDGWPYWCGLGYKPLEWVSTPAHQGTLRAESP